MNSIISRATYNWNITRILYTSIGILLSSYSAYHQDWTGTFVGLYFIIMGVFALGCAAGSCSIPQNTSQKIQ